MLFPKEQSIDKKFRTKKAAAHSCAVVDGVDPEPDFSGMECHCAVTDAVKEKYTWQVEIERVFLQICFVPAAASQLKIVLRRFRAIRAQI